MASDWGSRGVAVGGKPVGRSGSVANVALGTGVEQAV